MMNLKLKNKKCIIRVDFNVPLNNKFEITDDTRMQAALPTITKVIKEGGAAIILSHLGRPLKKKLENGAIDIQKFTLHHLVNHLSSLTGVNVQFCPETRGENAKKMAAELQMGEILLLENTRFEDGEKVGDLELAKSWASLGDLFINDAFGTAHRAHASTSTIAQFFSKDSKAFGLLMENEIINATKVINGAEKPVTAIVGGAKVSDKIMLLSKLSEFCDNILIGGGMAYTLIKAQGGNIGSSLCEEDKLDVAKDFLNKAKQNNTNIYLPSDSVVADDFNNNANIKVLSSGEIPSGWMGLDIGASAIKDFSDVIINSKTILWNGPMGVFEMENFANGTRNIAKAIVKATEKGAFSLIGGGDSVAAIKQMGFDKKVSFVSTGGGAMLEFLEGKVLPAIEAMD